MYIPSDDDFNKPSLIIKYCMPVKHICNDILVPHIYEKFNLNKNMAKEYTIFYYLNNIYIQYNNNIYGWNIKIIKSYKYYNSDEKCYYIYWEMIWNKIYELSFPNDIIKTHIVKYIVNDEKHIYLQSDTMQIFHILIL